MAKRETLNLRVSSEFKRRLRDEAAKDKRSVTNYVEATLTAVWDQLNSQKPAKKKTLSR